MGAAFGVADRPLGDPQSSGEVILGLAQPHVTEQANPGRGPFHSRSVASASAAERTAKLTAIRTLLCLVENGKHLNIAAPLHQHARTLDQTTGATPLHQWDPVEKKRQAVRGIRTPCALLDGATSMWRFVPMAVSNSWFPRPGYAATAREGDQRVSVRSPCGRPTPARIRRASRTDRSRRAAPTFGGTSVRSRG